MYTHTFCEDTSEEKDQIKNRFAATITSRDNQGQH